MSAPGARLRQLVEAATPGPWRAEPNSIRPQFSNVYAPNENYGTAGLLAPVLTNADAELVALAPSLAVLCADMADALAHPAMHLQGAKHDAESCFTCSSLLARFRALTQEPT